ncbi:Uncharacterized conserved protein [Plasmopara halstedii]|uniref:Uncharacterized conserved protein n=1 Tax=Plasmopara halstedii TaxID=4781 RepID=A0A0P1ANR0_PLAHL|nr:Uncharacterized conserved protein [Plasmopara halstedii]CEG42637.1 Uncharacterized conserved protein [Plasmopara halstedii]|eukprot:XP_024579006.1 Uncharacterized conserved protein [Plasmopara halstedii]
MLVPVEVDAAAKEWSMLEFQGDIIPVKENEKYDLRGLDIGSLRYTHNGEITLRIGNHVLAGKVTKLLKPFAILQKNYSSDDREIELASGNDNGTLQIKYKVVGIARTRVVFASRPKPVT